MYVYVCIFLIQHPPSYHHDSFMSSSALGLSTPMCCHKLRAFKNPNYIIYIYIYILYIIYNYGYTEKYTKLKIYNHQAPKRVSGNEKKTNIKYCLKKEKYIYIYVLVEYFVLNINTK